MRKWAVKIIPGPTPNYRRYIGETTDGLEPNHWGGVMVHETEKQATARAKKVARYYPYRDWLKSGVVTRIEPVEIEITEVA